MEKLDNPHYPVLVIDDDELAATNISLQLGGLGVTNVEACFDGREVTGRLQLQRYSLILLDLLMPVVSGWDLLPVLAEKYPDIPVIVLTGTDDMNTAISCIKAGAFDYLTKPCKLERLSTTIGNALELSHLKESANDSFRESPVTYAAREGRDFRRIVTSDVRMAGIFEYIEAIAQTGFPVLITGETGTGKELLARSVHEASGRGGNLVAVNAAGLDDTLFSDTLFGHKRGAFSGAQSDRRGMIAGAENGTLFLDEIGDLSGESQIRLLRLLQERVYFPLGSDVAITTTARIVFATNHELEERMKGGKFRPDLYYRLHAHHVHIPPLRERISDLPLLVEHFLSRAAESVGKPKPEVPPELYTILRAYDFPGNIRELEGMVNDAMVRHDGRVLSLDRFRAAVFDRLSPVKHLSNSDSEESFDQPAIQSSSRMFGHLKQLPSIDEADAELIRESLERSGGNQTLAAATLGISRQALNNRLRRTRAAADKPDRAVR